MVAANDTGKCQWFIIEAKRLRSLSVESECDFLNHLYEVGEKDSAMWTGAGYATFEHLLSAENLCDVARYSKFKAAVARMGFDAVRRIGFDAANVVLIQPALEPSRRDPGKNAQRATHDDLDAFVVRNGVTPSRRQAEAIARSHHVPERRVRVETSVDELRRLNEELTKENRALKKENARLTKELALAQAKIERSGGAQTTTTARKPKGSGKRDAAGH